MGAGFDLREGAVCRCNKRGCQDYFRGEKKRKLKEAMFQGSANDPCLPKQYRVKKVNDIWGIRYASNQHQSPTRLPTVSSIHQVR